MELRVLSKDKKGSASWSQVFIFSKWISYWYWLVSLLGAGDVVFYIVSTIPRGNSFGLQNMDMTHYDSMFGVIKDASNG